MRRRRLLLIAGVLALVGVAVCQGPGTACQGQEAKEASPRNLIVGKWEWSVKEVGTVVFEFAKDGALTGKLQNTDDTPVTGKYRFLDDRTVDLELPSRKNAVMKERLRIESIT